MDEIALAGVSVLLVEDEALLRRQLGAYLEHLGMDVTAAGTLAAARESLRQSAFDYAILDVNLPDGRGTDLLRDSSLSANTGAIVMTAEGGVGGAVEAMRLGALDYLVKPFDPPELPLVIQRARNARRAARLDEHRREGESGQEFVFGVALADVEEQLRRIVAADQRLQTSLAPVLIVGETGTGKTSIARWLHRHGPRAAQPLVEINCSALPETLAESELFGHERGAFTDARSARIGLFEAASGGTLFLDELPSLSLPLQAKVLAAIEDHTIRRLGGNKAIPVEVRIVAASYCDLRSLIDQGRFREDLYHRLDLFRLHLTPLRERGDDIERLAGILLERLCRRHRLPLRTLSPRGRGRLRAYRWPGNVRELAHELERSIVFAEDGPLNLDHLPVPEPARAELAGPAAPHAIEDWLNERYVFPEQGFSLDQARARLIDLALRQAGGNASAAARRLGVSRDVVRYHLDHRSPPE
ncbi:MAG TPA: sigma-54 dependent transcriptional regulator [Verrucomicrobiota bacterium]|nr:sigma-54 dependent transcriptional regulator [Verrucomicrobiota bacterium]HNU52291.1 sigma-54 dependent transcriptional regulator [Verrucomicrobiota bacterium]